MVRPWFAVYFRLAVGPEYCHAVVCPVRATEQGGYHPVTTKTSDYNVYVSRQRQFCIEQVAR